MTMFACGNARRLLAVKLAGVLDGIEYVEVRDTAETDPAKKALRQRTLYVRMLKPVTAVPTVVIDGGERIASVDVQWAFAATALPAAEAYLAVDLDEPDHVLVVRTAERGDFSRYRLALVATPGSDDPPAGFDPLLAEVTFSFKAECPSDFDCKEDCACPPQTHTAPTIDYLAKDFQGFRRIMLERMAQLAPGWTERNAADVGVTLVELMAYVGDELSYRQDAVATEAYLGTARSRISLRRLARLVDYRMHDGCNARTWVQVHVQAPAVILPQGTTLLSTVPGLPSRIAPDSPDHHAARDAHPVVFETVEEAVLDDDLNEMRLWMWGDLDCCLPAGATTATLRGHHPALRAGDVVVIAETISPTTGKAADADPGRRFAVRLVDVSDGADPSGALFPGGTTEITHLRWRDEDALPGPVCLSAGEQETACVWGNIVLADHGETVPDEELSPLEARNPVLIPRGDDGCGDTAAEALPPRYRPTLQQRPLTRCVAAPAEVLTELPFTAVLAAELATGQSGDQLEAAFAVLDLPMPDGSAIRGVAPLWSVSSSGRAWLLRERDGMLQVLAEAAPAACALGTDTGGARPALSLRGVYAARTDTWEPVVDLLGSNRFDRDFVAETEFDGVVTLRFGDGEHGLRPPVGTEFSATYRVGNGVAGNVGRAGLAHAVTAVTAIDKVMNPLPAGGGAEPETADEVRRDAPYAFAVQQRAVTEADYAEVSQRNREVQRAAATFRWTGSWHTVFVTADRFGGGPVDAAFEGRLRDWLERFRMVGYDLEVDSPVFVPLDISLHVCVVPGYFRSDVASELRAVLSDGVLSDGSLGLFHPDNLTFGQPVYLSSVLAATHAVRGVQSVKTTRFERQRLPQTSGLADGLLPMGRLEIARLDDDPNFPERGVLELTFGGGS
ncbi:putative baseplate assembly protein [Mycolicibacterium psychrotolerans]|uniref:Baseplate assembly protein n=1 Tax=Mycolicibacterium psychrotolerans TaxID=216929 RepID=A0A7I7MF16_9MYCO|nr:putative baseplate assembly protein [Mycolicibacterium psychrotolerans]BBX69959.1 hypothetical protein MPSYJ_34200 [Mycolicibacterium psychrotolerans]